MPSPTSATNHSLCCEPSLSPDSIYDGLPVRQKVHRLPTYPSNLQRPCRVVPVLSRDTSAHSESLGFHREQGTAPAGIHQARQRASPQTQRAYTCRDLHDTIQTNSRQLPTVDCQRSTVNFFNSTSVIKSVLVTTKDSYLPKPSPPTTGYPCFCPCCSRPPPEQSQVESKPLDLGHTSGPRNRLKCRRLNHNSIIAFRIREPGRSLQWVTARANPSSSTEK